jgi:HSP20 family protein
MANNLTRFNPFGDVARFEPFRDLDKFFSDFHFSPALREYVGEPHIKMDVLETDKSYTVKAEMPGLKKEDITIDIDKNQVTIKAEARKESEQKEGRSLVRSERYYGQQFRSFTLAHDVDDSKATAKYQDGLLEIDLPKKAGNGAKKLSIS